MKSIVEVTDLLEDQLREGLPHGSGVDCDWTFLWGSEKKVKCSNSFHAMDEYGGYCHYYDFSIILSYDPGKRAFIVDKVSKIRERCCCGIGLREYLADLFYPIEIPVSFSEE